MKIFVDADACPVKKTIIEVAQLHHVEVILVSSYAHYSPDAVQLPYVQHIMVDSFQQSADLYIINRIRKGDVVVTQDYGLAAMVISKKGQAIHHTGFEYTEQNIDELMYKRHLSAKVRRAGGKTKGPKAYTEEDEQRFKALLTNVLQRIAQ